MLTSERNLQILYLLINVKTMQINDLIKFLNVSEKTIIRAINNLNIFLEKIESKILIEKQTVLLKGNIERILEEIYKHDENDIFSTYERQIYILNFLLNNEKASLDILAEDIIFPITTLKKDIDLLNRELAQVNSSILLTKKRGMTILEMNSEQTISVFSELIHNQIMIRKNNSILKTMSIEKIFNPYIYRYLKLEWKIENFSLIYKKLIEEKNIKQTNISDFELIYISLLICLWLNHEKNIDLFKETSNLNNVSINKILKEIYIPTDKKIFINNFLETLDQTVMFVREIVDELEEKINKLFNHNVYFSNEAKENIKNHTTRILNSSKISNVKTNLQVDQNILFEGISKYIESFSEIWKLIRQIVNQYLQEFNVNDILTYEIFIYVVVWFDQLVYSYPANIKTVCIGGMGQSSMIQHHLMAIYKTANIEAKQYALLTKHDYEKSDLIISAIPIENNNQENVLSLSFMSVMSNKEIIHKTLRTVIYKRLITEKKKMKKSILDIENIKVNLPSVSKEEAIKAIGQQLVDNGYVKNEYINSMLNRENHVTTYIGNYIAIPHGEAGSEQYIIHTGLAIHHYPQGIKFNDDIAYFIVGIGSNDEQHLEILSNIAEKFSDIDKVNKLIASKITTKKLYDTFNFNGK